MFFGNDQSEDSAEVNDFKCRNFTPGLQDPIQPKPVTGSDLRVYDVIVIGAGVAGLEAAHELDSEEIDVMVLEARDRIGGRINTIHYGGTSLDLGGSWIHGYDAISNEVQNPIYKIAYENNIQVNVTDGTTEIRYPSGRVEYTEFMDAMVEDFKNHIKEIYSNDTYPDHNLKTALTNYAKTNNAVNENKATYDLAMNYEFESDQASDVTEISAKYGTDSQYFRGLDDIEVIFPEGYNQIVNCLAGGLDIKHATVEKVNYASSPVEVSTDNGIFKARYVISTIPLGVLRENMVELFDPDFNQTKTDSIMNLKMGTMDKTYIIFNADIDVFWNYNEYYNEWIIRGVTEKDNDSYDPSWRSFFSLYKFTGKPILLAFNVGSTAERLEKENDDTIKEQIMSALKEMYPNYDIPEPEKIIRTSWKMEPLSNGSYSFIPVNGSMEDIDELAKPINDTLFFAGEATNKHYYGTVHGAYISGYSAAQEILKLKNNADTIREQLDHGVHPNDICEDEFMLADKLSEDPKCIPIHD